MSNEQVSNQAIAPNAQRLLWAGFLAILAAGIGFGIRGGILANWGADFGFTAAQLGEINGAGFTGFCFGIIIGGLLCDKIGYGKLVVAAFALHVISAIVTFSASKGMAQDNAYMILYLGTFIFAVANGTLEAVANPLVATLFPYNRTHFLNILHASWPAGLVLGGFVGLTLGGHVSWKGQLALFLIPTVLYGLMFLGQKMPKSEASEKGLSLGEMMKDVGLLGGAVVCLLVSLFVKEGLGGMLGLLLHEPDFFASTTWSSISWGVGILLWLSVGGLTKGSVGSWLLFVLFVIHALVGAVELGTDGWIQNITGNILTPKQGNLLFVITSLMMFALRFCANFIEKRIGLSPIGILLTCSMLACLGLNLVSAIQTFGGAVGALLVYAVGKTFFWPTMLAVTSDRFPRTGAVAISIMGGIGMMSAGLIGSKGLGYAKDRFAGEELQKVDPAAYAEYKAPKPSKFLVFSDVYGLDGAKLGTVTGMPPEQRDAKQKVVAEANMRGDRRTLVADSAIPATMALLYFLIFLYFKATGGYRTVHLEGTSAKAHG